MRPEWTLTRSAFDNLLDWLSPNRDEAGRQYENIRGKLVRLFTFRGCEEPEELADETINRVIHLMESKTEEYSGEPIRFFFGVAKYVHKESLKRKLSLPAYAMPVSSQPQEQQLACLENCLHRLPQHGRSLISRYYQYDGQRKIAERKMLAGELGLGMQTLRIKAFRIRNILRECVSACLERSSRQ